MTFLIDQNSTKRRGDQPWHFLIEVMEDPKAKMADRVAAATALSRADDSRERTEALKDAIYGLGEKIEGAGHDIGGALDGIAKGVNPDHIEGKVYGSRAEYLASLGEG